MSDTGSGPWVGLMEIFREPEDVLRKLESDLVRIERDPRDPFPVVDFFLTADILADWFWPTNKAAREAERAVEPFATASHVANAVKHYEAKANHHRSVRSISTRRGYFQPDAFQAGAFDTGAISIERVDGSEADVDYVARAILAHLQKRVVEWRHGQPLLTTRGAVSDIVTES